MVLLRHAPVDFTDTANGDFEMRWSRKSEERDLEVDPPFLQLDAKEELAGRSVRTACVSSASQ